MSFVENFDLDQPVVCSQCQSDLIWSEREDCFVARGGLYDGADVCPDENGLYWAHDACQN